ncbi:hypothetical protein BP6252_11216 [Coleophoma cylindrospora]|uniref:PD-(D/E)XK nuclease-like domain-containing protein n=1 Tax=Coleophoma cylindrospora TaxID=1849047 RepID=A0A3D8QPM0_9HELO|nr:hypothetical protein BP6252_11216 [Coleophoma cylindrospora]
MPADFTIFEDDQPSATPNSSWIEEWAQSVAIALADTRSKSTVPGIFPQLDRGSPNKALNTRTAPNFATRRAGRKRGYLDPDRGFTPGACEEQENESWKMSEDKFFAVPSHGDLPLRKPRSGTHSPSKRRRREHDLGQDEDVFDDQDATPRSNKQNSQILSSFEARMLPPSKPSPSPSPAVSRAETTSSSTQSTRSSRSRSPVKMSQLEMSRILPVQEKEFGTSDCRIPPMLKEVYEDICEIVTYGDGVIPRSFGEAGKMDFKAEKIRPSLVGDEAEDGRPSDLYYMLVEQIRDRAAECRQYKVSEAEWNCEVHSRVLDVALYPWKKRGVWYRNATAAKINDPSLVNLQSKMVDFCITTQPDGMYPHVIRRVQSLGLNSINQTEADYFRYTPIAVSIETKRAAIDEDNATAQLSIWIGAQFMMLARLVPPNKALPPMILVMVQGHEWKMLFAEYSSFPRGIQIMQSQSLGQTSSILGICKVIASLRRIAKYVADVYTPWFEENVLQSDEYLG